jgi:hypothetical protein
MFKVSKDPAFAPEGRRHCGDTSIAGEGGGAGRRRSGVGSDTAGAAITFDATEKRTHDYLAWCDESVRSAARRAPAESSVSVNPPGTRHLPGLPEKAVKPYADKETYLVLDNLSTHTAPDVCGWLEKKSARRLPLTRRRIWFRNEAPHQVRHAQPRSGEPSPPRRPNVRLCRSSAVLGLCASSGLRIPPDLYRIGIEQSTRSLLDLPGITRATHNAWG